MPKSASPTKSIPSNSKAKKRGDTGYDVVAAAKPKKKAARPAKKVEWRVMWIRTIGGEEYVANTRLMSDGVLMYDPTMITYLQGNMVLAPYGLMSQGPTFFFPASTILHVNEVTENIEELYFSSLENALEHCRLHFDALVEKSIGTVKRARFDRADDEVQELTGGLLSEAEEAIDKMLGLPEEFNSRNEGRRPRSRNEAIDDLVKLAESKGKGKKPSGD